jgi:nucleoside-diphosphate-sugar epimerase
MLKRDIAAQCASARFFKGVANMYAVTGITGKVGAAVARSLLSADQLVRAVVRDRAKGASWADLGCDIAVADFGDAAALAKAFEGMDGVFAMLPPVFDPSPGFPEARAFIASMFAALAEAKPNRVVALSTIGADSPNPNLLNVLGLMEDALKGLPVPGRAARSVGVDFPRPGHEESNTPNADARRIQRRLDRFSESRCERPQGLHRHRSGDCHPDPKRTPMNQTTASGLC